MAAKHLAPRLQSDAPDMFATAGDVLEALERVYADPDQQCTALSKFGKLYQGSQTFNEFWAKFQLLTVELDMTEQTLIDHLTNKISNELQWAIVNLPELTTVLELAQQCQRFDQNIQRAKENQARIKKAAAQRNPTSPSTSTSTLATTSDCTKSSEPHTASNPHSTHPDPAKERLMQQGRCFHCQEHGHMMRDCSRPAAPRVTAIEAYIEDTISGNKDPSR